MSILSEMFSYSFFIRAIIVGILVSLCSSLLGVTLVLKRYSMIGDGLSHVGFGAMAIAAAVGASPLYVAIPVVVISAFFLLRISESGKLKGDAAIGVISSGALAVGVIIVSVTKGMNTDLYNYMFGSILSLGKGDVYISIILSAVILVLYVLFYNRIFAITFDEPFSRATGINTSLYNTLIAVLTAVTVVLGMRMMGALLISSLIIFPPLIALMVCKSFKATVITSGVVSVICFFVGAVLSYVCETPTGASVVAANLLLFAVISAVQKIRKR